MIIYVYIYNIYIYIYIYIYVYVYVYYHIIIKFLVPVNAIVRLTHPPSKYRQGQETFLAPSADKQIRNYECSNHHP